MKPRWGWGSLLLAAALVTGCAGSVDGAARRAGVQPPVAGSVGVPSPLGPSPQGTAPGPPATSAPAGGTVPPGTVVAGPTGGAGATAAGSVAPVQEDVSWLKPGARLSYQLGAVASAADRSTWTEDPAGTLVDPATGKRYSSDRLNASASQAAQGVRSLDVVSVDGSAVIVAVDDLLFDGGTNTFSPIPNPTAGPARGKPGDLWIAPSTLAGYQGSAPGAGNQVLTGPYEFNGQQVNAIVLVNNDPNSYYFFAYDLASGILLRGDTSTVYQGTSSPTSPNTTNTRSSIELKSLRQRTFPGAGAALPSWAAQGATLNYTGQYALIDPSTGQPTSGVSVGLAEQVSITPGGTTWGSFQKLRQVQGAQGTETASGYVTSVSTYAMDPTSLAAMQSGTVLDQDPVTGEKWTVQQVANGQVVIGREMSGYQWLGAYDVATGKLLQAQLTTSLGVTQIQLTG